MAARSISMVTGSATSSGTPRRPRRGSGGATARAERLPDGRTLDLNGDGLGDLVGYAPSASPGLGGAIASVRSYSGVFRAGDVNGDRRSDLLAYDPVTGAGGN